MAALTTWYTLDGIRRVWRDAPSDDAVLQELLDTAQEQVLEFDNGATWRRTTALNTDPDGNPVLYPGDYPNGVITSGLALAHRTQTRNLWNANKVDPSNGAMGDDTFTVRPFPLDWTVKAMIRPKRVIGALG